MKRFFIFIIFMSSFLCISARADETSVLQQVYQTALDNYISDVELSKLVYPALKSLSQFDKNIKVVLEKNTVTIYFKGKLYKVHTRPKDEQNAKQWAKFTASVLTTLKEISPDFKRRDFELVDLMLYHGVSQFDANSHYYPALDVGQNLKKFDKIQSYVGKLLENDILYIRLGTINEYTMSEFKKTMAEYPEPKGILIDLRGNQGGYLQQAVEFVDVFLDKGIIASTVGKNPGKRKFYRAQEGDAFAGVPMVILVDGVTASSAEVIAGALQDQGRAKLVGAQTYGKGTVQNIYHLENGSDIAFTTEHFYTPQDYDVHWVGLKPNVCSEFFAETEDIDTILNTPYKFLCTPMHRNSPFDMQVALHLLQSMQVK